MRQPVWIAAHLTASLLGVATAAWSDGPYGFNQTVPPCRLIDTRLTDPVLNPHDGPLPSGVPKTFDLWGRCGIPAGGPAGAIFVNVTAVNPTAEGFLVLYASDSPLPPTSVVNVVGGAPPIGNGVLVSLSAAAGRINVVYGVAGSGAQTTHVILDVLGHYATTAPLHFFGLPACRLLDTRKGSDTDGGHGGAPNVLFAPGPPRHLKVRGRCQVPPEAIAVTLTLTVVGPTSDGFLVAYPYDASGTNLPQTSSLNFPALILARANGTIVPLIAAPADWDITVVAGGALGGATDLLVDVSGYYKE